MGKKMIQFILANMVYLLNTSKTAVIQISGTSYTIASGIVIIGIKMTFNWLKFMQPLSSSKMPKILRALRR